MYRRSIKHLDKIRKRDQMLKNGFPYIVFVCFTDNTKIEIPVRMISEGKRICDDYFKLSDNFGKDFDSVKLYKIKERRIICTKKKLTKLKIKLY